MLSSVSSSCVRTPLSSSSSLLDQKKPKKQYFTGIQGSEAVTTIFFDRKTDCLSLFPVDVLQHVLQYLNPNELHEISTASKSMFLNVFSSRFTPVKHLEYEVEYKFISMLDFHDRQIRKLKQTIFLNIPIERYNWQSKISVMISAVISFAVGFSIRSSLQKVLESKSDSSLAKQGRVINEGEKTDDLDVKLPIPLECASFFLTILICISSIIICYKVIYISNRYKAFQVNGKKISIHEIEKMHKKFLKLHDDLIIFAQL